MLASDDRFYNFDYIVERDRRAAPRRRRARPRAASSRSTGFSIYDVDPKAWELRERLFAIAGVLERRLAQPTTSSTAGGARTGAQSVVPAVRRPQRVRAIGPDPGGEIEPPSYFKREEKPSDTMGFGELRAYIASLETRGFDVAKLRVQLHRKLAFPMVGLVMTLLAVPFSFVVARRGALYGIGIAIVIAIVYWAVLEHLRGARQQRAPPPGARRLGAEPALRRGRAVPDPHAGDVSIGGRQR